MVKDADGDIFPLLASNNSRLIYIRDNDTGEFWTLNWLPIKHQYDYFEAKFSLGSAQISSSNTNIDCSLTISQAAESAMEIWQITIGNGAERKRRLSIFVVAQWDQTEKPEQQRTASYKRVLITDAVNSPKEKTLVKFMTSDSEIEDFDGHFDAFVGPYGDLQHPKVVVDGKVNKSKGSGKTAIGCLQKNIVLAGKGVSTFNVFVGGVVQNSQTPYSSEKIHSQIQAMLKPYLKDGSAQTGRELLHKKIRAILEQQRLSTPETELNRYHNFFLQYQALLRAQWPTAEAATAKSNYSALLAAAPLESDAAEAVLFSTLAHQTKEGRVANNWIGSETSITTNANVEDSLFLVDSVLTLLSETGDLALLRCPVDYLDGGQGTILEHSIKAVEYVLENRGESGLIAEGAVESTLATLHLVSTLQQLEPVLEKSNEHHLAKKYRQISTNLQKQVEKMWMSPWYSRGKLEKTRISPQASEHGFDLETQIRAITSNVSTAERSKQLIDKLAKQHVALPPLNFSPAYHHFSEHASELSSTSPGMGLNSVVDPEQIIQAIGAAVSVGNADVAWRWFKQVCAIYCSNPVDRYMAEPYWQPVRIDGPESDRFGAASTAFTSNAGQLLTVLTEKIIGIQPTLDGLLVKPCIPKNWRNVEFSRHFRGADYQFRIQNPFRVSSGIDRIIVDGIRINSHTIRPFSGGLHFVEIILG